MKQQDLLALGLDAEQAGAIAQLHEEALAQERARADEAFHQLNDLGARVERYEVAEQLRSLGARDPGLVAQLIRPGEDVRRQAEALRQASPYLFEPRRGGVEMGAPRAEAKLGMNGFLRGR